MYFIFIELLFESYRNIVIFLEKSCLSKKDFVFEYTYIHSTSKKIINNKHAFFRICVRKVSETVDYSNKRFLLRISRYMLSIIAALVVAAYSSSRFLDNFYNNYDNNTVTARPSASSIPNLSVIGRSFSAMDQK